MKYINWCNNLVAKIETVFLITILLTMILLAFLQVILRNFFSTSIFWGDTFLRHLVLWIGFLGASLATKEKRHINIDILSRFLSSSQKRISGFLINWYSYVGCFFLMEAAFKFIKFEKESGSTLFGEIPVWIFQIIIVVGFGLMMLRFLLHAIDNLIQHSKKASEGQA